MEEEAPEVHIEPYMLSTENAAKFMGMGVLEFGHFSWLLALHSFYAGEHHYYRRTELTDAAERLFAESLELGARLQGLSAERFWAEYDRKYDSDVWREKETRKHIRKEMGGQDVEEVAYSLNFGNSMELLGGLSRLEKARVVDVFMELDVLTAIGKGYHARVAPDLVNGKGKR
jgi:hypothetical protein